MKKNNKTRLDECHLRRAKYPTMYSYLMSSLYEHIEIDEVTCGDYEVPVAHKATDESRAFWNEFEQEYGIYCSPDYGSDKEIKYFKEKLNEFFGYEEEH